MEDAFKTPLPTLTTGMNISSLLNGSYLEALQSFAWDASAFLDTPPTSPPRGRDVQRPNVSRLDIPPFDAQHRRPRPSLRRRLASRGPHDQDAVAASARRYKEPDLAEPALTHQLSPTSNLLSYSKTYHASAMRNSVDNDRGLCVHDLLVIT